MIGWQWHQLNHMQVICTSLQIDNYTNTSSLSFLRGWMLFLSPNQQHQSTEGTETERKEGIITSKHTFKFQYAAGYVKRITGQTRRKHKVSIEWSLIRECSSVFKMPAAENAHSASTEVGVEMAIPELIFQSQDLGLAKPTVQSSDVGSAAEQPGHWAVSGLTVWLASV